MHSLLRPQWHHLVVFVLPAMLLYSVFMSLPLLDSLRLSLYQTQSDSSLVFVGLKQFSILFTDSDYSPRFWGALHNNMLFFSIFMLIQNPIGLLLAELLSSGQLRGSAIYRTVIFAPTTLSVVIVGWIWTLMLNPIWGVINDVFKAIGIGGLIPKEGWLGSTSMALIVVSLVGVWQYVGLPFILFLAALIGLDEELIDAARVDGASPWMIFWQIKFPLILPTVGIVTILTFVGNFSAFENVFVMQGSQAGPDYATDLLGTFFYRTMFGGYGRLPNLNLGTTIAASMFIIILIGVCSYLLIFQRRLVRD